MCLSNSNGVHNFHHQVYPKVSKAYGDKFLEKVFKLVKYSFLGDVD